MMTAVEILQESRRRIAAGKWVPRAGGNDETGRCAYETVNAVAGYGIRDNARMDANCFLAEAVTGSRFNIGSIPGWNDASTQQDVIDAFDCAILLALADTPALVEARERIDA